MPPVVTSSRRRHPRQNSPHHILAVAVIAVLCVAGVFCAKHFRKTAGEPPVPVVTETTSLIGNGELGSGDPEGDAGRLAPSGRNQEPDRPATRPTAPATNSPANPAATPVVTALANRETEKPNYGQEVEQILAMLASASDSAGGPPLPDMGGIDLNRSLLIAITNDIVVYEDDDPETVAMKERIADMKNQLKEVVDAGGSVEAAILEYHDWVNENQRIRAGVISEYRRLVREASREEADAYIVEANKELEAEGIETVNMGVERRRGTMKAMPAGMRHARRKQEGNAK